MTKYKNRANTITIEQAQEDYKEIINECLEKNLWLQAKGLNLWLSPFELIKGWHENKYLFPVTYFEVGHPDRYLKIYADQKRKTDNIYEYAHKRYQNYIKELTEFQKA